MTIHVSVTHNERTGQPLYVDIHYREPGGPVHPNPVSTYSIEPGEARSFAVHPGRVLVVREAPPIAPLEEF